jgi:VanZ family protein
MLVGHSKPESIDYRTTIGKNWPFVALMVLGLFLSQLSGETGSAGRMFRFFTEVLGMNDSVSEVIVFWVRKGVHVGFYGALAWLAAKWMANRGAETKWVLASGFLWSGAHGAYDEFFQASVPSRTGSVGDFLLDMLGAAMFLAPYWWPLWRNRHNQSR